VDSIIHPVIAELIGDALEEADAAGAAAVVIELATPGGLMESTRQITTAMLAADTPVVVYVAPSGAQAASAGFFILMAADVAAMAPGTNTGAAHPVLGGGEDIEGTLGEKIEQDAAAQIRALAQRHGRNVELAETAVMESRSFSAEEALEAGLVDLISPGLPALLTEIDGRPVERGGETIALATGEAALREIEMSPWRRVLSVLAHPNVTALLLTLGMLGLYFELMNPGSILPGVVGAIALILGLYGLSVLPFSFAGLALILLAVVLFIAEIKVVSYGLLTVGGVVSLIFGMLLLFKTAEPALRVSLEVIFGLAAFAAVVVTAVVLLVLRARRNPVRTGSEGLLHQAGRVVSELAPRGKVFVHGEIWHAVSDVPVASGQPVEVIAVEGMLLRVRPLAVPEPVGLGSA
jgi:membrane-bound serine protease (ClpP class)